MFDFQNLDLLSVGIAVAAISILGFVILFNNVRSVTNRNFLYFALSAGLWSVANYLSYQSDSPSTVLLLIRLGIFFAVWYSYFLCRLFYVFPKDNFTFSKNFKFILTPFVAIVSALTLTPLVFSSIKELSTDGASVVVPAPGIVIFGITVVGLIVSAIYSLVNKIRTASGNEKRQLEFILYGTTLTFLLHLGFNFILPAGFDIVTFIPFGAVFTFPLVAFAFYAIFKHNLLNVKVISTEILTFILAVVAFAEVIFARNAEHLIFRISTFLLILSFGILLIKSVLHEARHRDQLQILTGKLKEANKQLKILDQARAEFISMASHQLRTPPSSIKWYLSALLADEFGKLPPEIKEALVRVNTTNNSMISLIDALLNVSRIERGKLEFVFEEADLAEITQITIDQLAPLAREKGLELVYNKPAAPLPKLIMDKEKLRQVINNMIDNAIKYSKKGKIEISIEKTKRDATLKVRDNGKGMSAKELDVSFSKYGRGKDSIKYSAGLGLGMYLAKVIVEQHNGKIWAESPGADKGSTFAFSVPINNKIKPTSLIFDLTKTQNVK